eukprot:294323_1
MDSVSSVDSVEANIKKEDTIIVGSDTEMVQAKGQTMAGEENDAMNEDGLKLEGVEYDVNEVEAKKVRLWLDSIGCSKYYNVFIQNGFDSLDIIKEINDVQGGSWSPLVNELNDIGIRLKAHQLKLFNNIKKLKKKKKTSI